MSPRDVVVIADSGAVQAIPTLEQQFRSSTDVDLKVSIASGLVILGDRYNTYWNFLLEQATLAVDSNVPDPAYSESQRKGTNQSPELQAWADAHSISYNVAWQEASLTFPVKILQLAITGDSRGIPLLRRALHSHNYLIVATAAKGLAKIRDKDSVPLIIVAAQTAPVELSSLIAEPLVYFDDAQAQGAVKSYMSKERATTIREARAQGRGVFEW